MPSHRKRNLVVLAAFAAAGYGIAKVNAEGAPTSQPLWYSGTLADESGVPLEGNYDVEVRLTALPGSRSRARK